MMVGIITVSDRAAAGQYEDLGGPALRDFCSSRGWTVFTEAIVPDGIESVRQAITSFSRQGCQLILTTGGTGLADRDLTPEAIRGIMKKELPGFGEVMRSRSLPSTPNAILSRCLAAVVDNALVIALPGKPQGAVDCLGFVVDAIPHAIKIASGQPTSC